jgi:hypothetical protein
MHDTRPENSFLGHQQCVGLDKLTQRLEFWTPPRRTASCSPNADDPARGWRTISYTQALDAVRQTGAVLLQRDLSAEPALTIPM